MRKVFLLFLIISAIIIIIVLGLMCYKSINTRIEEIKVSDIDLITLTDSSIPLSFSYPIEWQQLYIRKHDKNKKIDNGFEPDYIFEISEKGDFFTRVHVVFYDPQKPVITLKEMETKTTMNLAILVSFLEKPVGTFTLTEQELHNDPFLKSRWSGKAFIKNLSNGMKVRIDFEYDTPSASFIKRYQFISGNRLFFVEGWYQWYIEPPDKQTEKKENWHKNGEIDPSVAKYFKKFDRFVESFKLN